MLIVVWWRSFFKELPAFLVTPISEKVDIRYLSQNGYIEYSDCRALLWQEQDKAEKMRSELMNQVPFACKK